MQYPVSTSSYRLKLQYGYANGILQTISDFNAPTTVFWKANATDVRGQVTQETLGNGVVTNRAFDPVTGWLGSIKAGVGGGATLENYAVTYDFDGNIHQRQDVNNPSLLEVFAYDADNRLDHSTLNSTLNLQMTYDTAGMGNIASRSDVNGGAAWTYFTDKKHAVKQAGAPGNTYAYDANGNTTKHNGVTGTTWTSFNQPSLINGASSQSLQYYYNGNHQRYYQLFTSTSNETTYFVGSLLEKVLTQSGTTDYRHYISVGGRRVALVSRLATGTNATYYLLGDHISSTNSILNPDGTLFIKENYGPYGNGRVPATWSGATSTSDQTQIATKTTVGFTGETTNLAMNLVNLNGRMLDAVTGRFMSADPLTANPGNTQSWNRYSYVNNNPLTYTDPTGFLQEENGKNTGDDLWDWAAFGQANDCSGDCSGNKSTGTQSNSGSGYYVKNVSLKDYYSDPNYPSISVDGPTADVDPSSGKSSDNSPAPNTEQSSTSPGGGCNYSICLEVDAPRYPKSGSLQPAAFPETFFSCGNWKCGYQMGPWDSPGYNGVWFNLNIYGRQGKGQWLQTFISSVPGKNPAGTFTPDSNGDFWGGPYSNDTWFYDDPAAFVGQAKLWVAQTSYLVTGQSGAAFTIEWGYQAFPNGGVSYIQPISVVPWASQLHLIQAHQ